MADGKVEIDVELNASQAESQAEAAGHRAGQKFGDALGDHGERHAGKLSEVMIGAARRIGEAFVDMSVKAVQGITEIAKAGVEFNAKMETYETAFTTLLGDAEKAEKVMAQIREDAASTPFDVDSLTSANQALIAAGVDAGTARKDVLNLANAIAAVGGGSNELSRMSANMQQIKNTGKATAMDIKQFANAGINIYGLLADSMGITTEAAAELKEVTYNDLTAAFEKAAAAGGQFEGALEKQSQTFNGRISTLKDNATQLAGVLTQDLFSTLSDNALPMVMDWVATLLEAAETGGIEGAISAAKKILSSLVQKLLDNLPKIIDTGLTLLENLLRGIIRALPKIVPVVLQIISNLIDGLIRHLPELLELGVELLVSIVTGLLEAIPWLISQIPTIITAIVDTFENHDWKATGKKILQGIWEGIKSLASWFTGGLRNLINGAIDTENENSAASGKTNTGGTTFTGGNTTLSTGTTGNIGARGSLLSAEKTTTAKVSSSFGGSRSTTINVPVNIDGREVARTTAYYTGEQLAWEEGF